VDFLERSNYFEIKLEDLLAFPEKNISNICDLLSEFFIEMVE
jgi:hypothetical protein